MQSGWTWAVLFGSLSACATLPHVGAPVIQLDVPFYSDDTDQCGPAALASVLTYWKIPTTAAQLKPEIYLAKLHGSLPIDLLIAAQKRLPAQIAAGTLENVRAELRARRPVIAYLNLGASWAPIGHYVVVVGYDEGGLLVHSGKEKAARITNKKFLDDWKKTDYWMLRLGPTP